MTTPSPRAITWLLISRAAALVIVFTLLIAFLVAAVLHTTLDTTVVIAFLSIASGLLFGPAAGYYLIVKKRNGNGSSG